jgi:UDP-N-acetylmuramoylalanine--D-glutamate ligase
MHNLQNIMIAVSACRAIGIPSDLIREVIYDFKGVEHRIEFVRELNGVKYYNDSKGTNTDATITALKAFDKGVILLVGGFEKGLSMDEMKKYLGCVKQVIGFGASGHRIATDLVGEKAIVVTTLDEAVNEAVKCSESGDIILLSPTTSSFDQYSCFEERGEHFKRIVNSL